MVMLLLIVIVGVIITLKKSITDICIALYCYGNCIGYYFLFSISDFTCGNIKEFLRKKVF